MKKPSLAALAFAAAASCSSGASNSPDKDFFEPIPPNQEVQEPLNLVPVSDALIFCNEIRKDLRFEPWVSGLSSSSVPSIISVNRGGKFPSEDGVTTGVYCQYDADVGNPNELIGQSPEAFTDAYKRMLLDAAQAAQVVSGVFVQRDNADSTVSVRMGDDKVQDHQSGRGLPKKGGGLEVGADGIVDGYLGFKGSGVDLQVLFDGRKVDRTGVSRAQSEYGSAVAAARVALKNGTFVPDQTEK